MYWTMRSLALMSLLLPHCVAAGAMAPPLVPVAGYTVTRGDCGYPVCGTLLSKGEVPHRTMDDIAAVCNATAGCEGFNSNGWLKGCLPPRCPAGLKGLEPTAPSNLYTKIDPPKPLPPPAPPAPVPDIEDAFYPTEEQEQLLAAHIPVVVSADPASHSCVLRLEGGKTVTVKEGGVVQGGDWTLLAVYAGAEVALERTWQRWSLLVLASASGSTSTPLTIRKPLGHLTQINLTTYKPDFIDFKLAASDPQDYIGQRIINDSEHGEASFLTAAKFLPPIADYVVIGDTHAPVKAVVTMDGTIKRSDGGDNEPIPPPGPPPFHLESHYDYDGARESLACTTSYDCRTPPRDRSYCFKGQCVGGGGPIFSAAAFLNQSINEYDQLQTGVLGGHLRVASIGCYSTTHSEGFEMMALGPLSPQESESLGFTRGNDTMLVALRQHMAESTGQPYTYLSFSLDKAPCSGGTPVGGTPGSLTAACQISAGQFFGAVLKHATQWKTQFDAGMQLQIPYAERRQIDMAKGVLVSGSTVFIGDAPNYGTGGNYWLSSPPARAMMDTEASRGIADSLPLTSLALDGALLRWGLFDAALTKVGFYFRHFVFANGTIDMGHWKDKWADAGDGMYNCTYPDGLTDHGRILQLFADTVRYTRNETWMAEHIGAAVRIAEFLLRARNESLIKFPQGDPRHGMIYGPAEHDTCDMGMGGLKGEPPQPLTDGQYMLYYFSVSMWGWRGMVELGTLLRDYPCDTDFDKPQCKMGRQLSATLLAEAEKFKVDIDAAVARSVVKFSPEAAKTYGAEMFVPSAVVPDGKPPLVFQSMTQDTLSEYSNFRYYSEMLSSDALDNYTAVQLQNFRENNGGCLSGMTRYSDHLDDMPAIGYAQASIASDRIQEYLLLLYGHAANYQGRGSFFSTEQESLYQDASNHNWRASLGEIQAAFCTPSQMLVSAMTAMQVLSESRDTEEIWLARAAPRRWYAEGFSVTNGPTRYGNISFAINETDSAGTSVTLSADFRQLPHVHAPQPLLHIRVRWPARPIKQVSSATASAGSDCQVTTTNAQLDMIDVQAKPKSKSTIENCKLQVAFE